MIKINLLKKNEVRPTTYYVDLEKGDDSMNSGLTPLKALKTYWRAFEMSDKNKDTVLIRVRIPGYPYQPW